MSFRFLFILCFFTLSIPSTFSQIDGANVFGEDQVITFNLEFSQTSFWDSLVENYESSTYMKADLIITDNSGTYNFTDVGARLKGNSSYSHPGTKKSFKIDFNRYVDAQNYDGLKKVNLSNGFKDPTLMREKIFFDICQDAAVPAPRANFANLSINGTLWGFYTLVEQIDDQFLDWSIEDDDGNMFKAGDNFGGGPGGGGDAADLLYYGTDQSEYEDRYELKSNEDLNDWTDLIEFIDFINNSTDTEFEDELADHLEVQEYLRSAALDNLFSNLDSYTESARNYYLYHNLTTDKWEWIKWDGNEAFGSYGGGGTTMTSLAVDYHATDRPLLENIFNSDVLYGQYLDEICYLHSNFFNSSYMEPRIDAIKTLIQNYVYADYNKMYSDGDFDTNIEDDISSGGGPFGGTTYGLKSFVEARSAFIDGAVDCSQSTGLEEVILGSSNLFPNPANSQTILEWEDPEVETVSVINSIGQSVYEASIYGSRFHGINVSEYNPGLYFVILKSENAQLMKKLVVVD